jgi:hypothetical protein
LLFPRRGCSVQVQTVRVLVAVCSVAEGVWLEFRALALTCIALGGSGGVLCCRGGAWWLWRLEGRLRWFGRHVVCDGNESGPELAVVHHNCAQPLCSPLAVVLPGRHCAVLRLCFGSLRASCLPLAPCVFLHTVVASSVLYY